MDTNINANDTATLNSLLSSGSVGYAVS